MKLNLIFSHVLILIILLGVFTVVVSAEDTPAPEQLAFSEDWLKGTVIVTYNNQYGTGFWINANHIATAAHVVSFDSNAVVTIIRGNIHSQGRVVALDRENDVAVIYVENADQFVDKHIFPLARTLPQPTSIIYVIGYPAELLQIMGSLETLSENPRVLESRLTWSANGLIELGGITDAGNSGGPVVDYAGNVIGIVSFALRGTAGTLYFATSVTALKNLCQANGIAYTESTAGILPEDFVRDPAAIAAVTGAAASLAVDVIIILIGIGLGATLLARKRSRK